MFCLFGWHVQNEESSLKDYSERGRYFLGDEMLALEYLNARLEERTKQDAGLTTELLLVEPKR